jgi:hypothetical protein
MTFIPSPETVSSLKSVFSNRYPLSRRSSVRRVGVQANLNGRSAVALKSWSWGLTIKSIRSIRSPGMLTDVLARLPLRLPFLQASRATLHIIARETRRNQSSLRFRHMHRLVRPCHRDNFGCRLGYFVRRLFDIHICAQLSGENIPGVVARIRLLRRPALVDIHTACVPEFFSICPLKFFGGFLSWIP